VAQHSEFVVFPGIEMSFFGTPSCLGRPLFRSVSKIRVSYQRRGHSLGDAFQAGANFGNSAGAFLLANFLVGAAGSPLGRSETPR
jgi:hypothetical protein